MAFKNVTYITYIYIYIYVRRKVGIGTIPELSCAKWEFSLCPPIPELFCSISESVYGVCVLCAFPWRFSCAKCEEQILTKVFEPIF